MPVELSSSTVGARPRGRFAAALTRQVQRFDNLKTRVAAGALSALLIGMALTAWYMGRAAEASLLERTVGREHVAAQQVAAVIGHRVAEMQRALLSTGQRLPRELLDRPEALAAFLHDKPVLQAMFANVFIAGVDGRLRMLSDPAGTRVPALNIAHREYFQRVLASGLAVISEPFEGSISNEPIVMFVQPLRDASGVWGVIGGSMRLASRDLIEDLAETGDFESTALLVVSDDRGRILAHPQRAMLLKALADEPRLADVSRQWQADGRPLIRDAGRWTSRDDVVAMAGEPVTGWHVWRLVATGEVVAPMLEAKGRALKWSALPAAALAGLLVLYLAWQLRPLGTLERRAAALMNGDATAQWPAATGEIGRLKNTLQHLTAERLQVERFNAQLLQRLRSVMLAAPVGLAFTRDRQFELVSEAWCRLVGYREDELVNRPAATVFASADDYAALGPLVGSAFAAGLPYAGNWQFRRADGSHFWGRLQGRPVAPGEPGAGTIWTLHDVSDELIAHRSLQHEATHDKLTGVRNRKAFEDAMAQAFGAHHEARSAAVVMIDLDHFKPINDAAGHAAGDAVLMAVARAIASQVRATDTVARIGGDEFAVVLPGCDLAHATHVAEKLRRAICDAVVSWDGCSLQVGASVGVAGLDAAHTGWPDWLAAADSACYEAKRAGRGTVRAVACDPHRADSAALA